MKENASLKSLVIGAIGVVYGDIGTSPLYALKSCFLIGSLAVTAENIIGLISLFLWTLFLVVSVKYVKIVLKFDNQGEGGILVLSQYCSKYTNKKAFPIILGIIGAALFFGDGIITPAISVLGALEGLHLISPVIEQDIIYLAIAILAVLFYVQSNGSGRIGRYFGPIMILWFLVLATLGIVNIYNFPQILIAFNPIYGLEFLSSNGLAGFLTIGGIILVVTGAEALYADLGHFGRKPIAISWTYFVFPSLLLTYLGQGALLLANPSAIDNPFYQMAPPELGIPLIILATIATIIASQAVITGVFSVTWQAIMLNYFPRMGISHTSREQIGQVYVRVINLILFALTVGAVLQFTTSANLAVAYGLSVSCVMLITTIFILTIAYDRWKKSRQKLIFLFVPFFFIDLIFVSLNIVKIFEGAWYTLLVTLIITYLVWVWIQGQKFLSKSKRDTHEDLDKFVKRYETKFPQKIPGTALFLSRHPEKIPNSLLIHLEHNKFLHEKILSVGIHTTEDPKVEHQQRYFAEEVYHNIYVINVIYGFQEIPDLKRVIKWAHTKHIVSPNEDISFFISKGIPIGSHSFGFNFLNEQIYIFLSKLNVPTYEFYKIPDDKVVELGIRYKV